jgi:hypothetical protein
MSSDKEDQIKCAGHGSGKKFNLAGSEGEREKVECSREMRFDARPIPSYKMEAL